jgi:hypothetical protein
VALNEQMQQMVQQDIQDAETRPKDEILQEQMDGLKTAGRTARDIAVESIPGVSEALAEKRVDEALQRGDTTGAIIEGAAGLMGAVPMVGDAAAKGLRAVTQSLRKQDIGEAEKLVDNPEKLQEWRDTNRLPESQRQKNISEAQQAAEDLFQGKIKSKEARKRINETFPEPKLYTTENMPEMPTVTDVVGSMGKKAEKGILGVKGFNLEPGQRVGARLDIPAYNEYDKWVVSIHDGKSRNGSVVGYGQAIRLKNIEFGSDPKVALDIAKGKRVAKTTGEEKPMGKATIARVFGDYVPEDPYELEEFAKKALADKDSGWTQVGMNPYRGSYFYDKATGTPVTRADEVIQVGPLVLAKNVTKPKMSELKEMFNTPAARTADGKLRVFNKGGAVTMNNMAEQMELFEPVERGFDEGGLMDEGGTVDPVSGNDVPPGSTQEEVRDDIPAQLSEGEFVFPADVVRYIGLENLMRMRQEAKQGLAQMEAMGQMGNSEEATVEDDLPFDMYDLDIDDEGEYNSDELKMQAGGMVPTYNPRTGTYSIPGSGMGGFQPAQQVSTTGYTPYSGVQPYTQPLQYTGTQYTTAEQTSNIPTFGEMVGSGYQGQELRTYVNDAGQTRQIPFVDGKPLYPIPEGFYPEGDKQPTVETAPIEQRVQTAQVRESGGRDDDTTPTGGVLSFGGTAQRDPRTGLPTGIVENSMKASFSLEGVNPYSMGKPMAMSFLDAISGGKMGSPLSLPEGATGVLNANKTGITVNGNLVTNATVKFSSPVYNSLVTQEGPVKVTSPGRTEINTTLTKVGQIFGKNYDGTINYEDAKTITDSFSDANGNIDEGKLEDLYGEDFLDRMDTGSDNFDSNFSKEVQSALDEISFGLSQMDKEEKDRFRDLMSGKDDGTDTSGPSADTVAEADAVARRCLLEHERTGWHVWRRWRQQ